MAELTVKFKTSGFSSAARTLGRSFDSRYNDYQGIRKKVLNESTSRSYLSSSGSYLQKKMDGLDSKRDKLDAFKKNVEGFCEEAKRVDQGVAKRLKHDAKDVYKKLGIKTGFWATTATFFKGAGKAIWNGLKDTWGAIKAGARTVWEAVKDFYEKHKDIINVIITAVAVIVVAVACIATGGALLTLIGVGLLMGLASQAVNDLMAGKLSTWESYVGASAGGGIAGAIQFLCPGNTALSGAVNSAVSSLVTMTLENITGKAKHSFKEIAFDTILSGAISGVIGGIFDKISGSKFVSGLKDKAYKVFRDKIDIPFYNGIKKLFDPSHQFVRHGLLSGSGNPIADGKRLMTNLIKKRIGNLGSKSVVKIVYGKIVEVGKKKIEGKIKDAVVNGITNTVMDRIINPYIVNPLKDNPRFQPLFIPQYVPDTPHIDNLRKIIHAI